MLKCSECGGEVRYYFHPVVLKEYRVNKNGVVSENSMMTREDYDGRILEEYGECIDCGQIYKVENDQILIEEKLIDYPFNLGIDSLSEM